MFNFQDAFFSMISEEMFIRFGTTSFSTPSTSRFFAMAEVETTRRSLPRQTKKAENQKEEEENKELCQNLSQIFRWDVHVAEKKGVFLTLTFSW